MFVQPYYFVSYYFYWIEYDDFFFHFQETYNSRLRERYGDDPSTHLEFNPDLWMEVWSSGGPDKNRVYGLSNTMVKNLRSACSVSTVGSSPSVSSTSLRSSWPWNNNMNNSWRIMINSVKWLWRLDQGWVLIHAQPLFLVQSREQPASSSSTHSAVILV
jgi:hypothetical protein